MVKKVAEKTEIKGECICIRLFLFNNKLLKVTYENYI